MKSVISKREVPKDLQGIDGMQAGFLAPDVQHTRIVITGQPGSGKSTLLNSNPQLMMLDPERGGGTVKDPQALRFTPPPEVQPNVLDKAYLEFADKIIARKLAGKTDILMLGIDTLDEFIDLFLTALCLRHGVGDPIDLRDGSGNGYTIVRKEIFGMLDKAYRAGIGWAIICHTRTKTVRIGKDDKQVSGLAISDSFKGAVFQKCEHMLFVEHGIITALGDPEVKIVGGKRIEKPGKRESKKVRKLKTKPGGLWMGGDTNDVKVRVPLEDELVLPQTGGWGVFAQAYDNAVARLQEGE